MSNNLMIENLSKSIDLGGGGAPVSDQQVLREMQKQGMEAPSQNAAQAPGATTFSETLRNSVDKVNQDQVNADTSIKELVSGKNKNIHETMLAVEKADASLKLMMQVRNKVLDAYREIMRMQV